MNLFRVVREFHQKFSLPIAEEPQMLDRDRFEFRCQLHHEEQRELEAAFAAQDLVKIADGLGDLLFVVAGTCVEFGLPMEAVLQAITNANMNKQPALLKPVKGPDWIGPESEIRDAMYKI